MPVIDSYKNENHNCLRNRLDITDQTKLDDIESTLSYFQMIELDSAPIDKQFNLENLQGIVRLSNIG